MQCSYLERPGKVKLAYHYSAPSGSGKDLPQVFFLGGFKSDMGGTKATWLEARCAERGQGYLRFDYSGHGHSGGKFEDGTIGSWMGDALDIFDHIGATSVILVGSSMGGWISLLVARQREKFLAGVIGIAAAPDFTLEMRGKLSDAQRAEMAENGHTILPNEYSDEPYIITQALFEESDNHLLLADKQDLEMPLIIIQGMLDPDVPWEITSKIESAYAKADLDIVLIDDGDHRLSRPEDLEVIDKEIAALSNRNNVSVSL